MAAIRYETVHFGQVEVANNKEVLTCSDDDCLVEKAYADCSHFGDQAEEEVVAAHSQAAQRRVDRAGHIEVEEVRMAPHWAVEEGVGSWLPRHECKYVPAS